MGMETFFCMLISDSYSMKDGLHLELSVTCPGPEMAEI